MLVLLAVLVLFAAIPVSAVLSNSKMHIYAVTNDGEGLGAEMELEIEQGNGTVWVASEPLVGTSTQSAAKLAKEVAKNYAKNVDKYDYKFRISSNASVVEGPSAGAAMTLLIISMLNEKPLDQKVSLTGTINEDGSVGPIGGAFEKAKAASKDGIALFMIPRGEAIQTVRLPEGVKSINMLDYGPKELGVKIVEVSTIDDVLQYAYADIESIDVDKNSQQLIPEFVPKPISYAQKLAPMKKLTDNYLKETSQLIEGARLSVSTTLIDDPSLINALLEILNSSQQTLHQAEILNDQNYIYSAANFAFLARVNAMIIKDISENPSLLEPGSTIFRLKLDTLKVDIDNLQESLDRFVPADYIEWHISAQQRVSYAALTYQKLNSTQVVVIQNGNGGYDALLDQISDYEFAVAWVDVAKDFYEITKNSEKRARLNPQLMAEKADALIVEAENKLGSLDKEENEDIFRRLDSAKLERQSGWNLAAAFDAASAIALSEGEVEVEGKTYEELKTLLEEKIARVEGKIRSNGYDYAWPSLYLDHSKYFIESGNYYSSLNQGSTAANSLRNGISLITLADKLVDVAKPVYSYYDSLDENQLINPGNPDYGPVKSNPIEGLIDTYAGLYFMLGTVAFLIAALLVVLIVVLSRQQRSYPIQSEIMKVKELTRKADESFMQGKIKEEKHNELLKRYGGELKHLENIRRRRLSHLLDIDRYRGELIAYETRLKDLDGYIREGVISKAEFNDKSQQFKKKISELKSLMGSQTIALKLETNELKALADSEVFFEGNGVEKSELKTKQIEKSQSKSRAAKKVYGRKNFSKAQQKKPSPTISKKGPSVTMQRIAGEALKRQGKKPK